MNSVSKSLAAREHAATHVVSGADALQLRVDRHDGHLARLGHLGMQRRHLGHLVQVERRVRDDERGVVRRGARRRRRVHAQHLGQAADGEEAGLGEPRGAARKRRENAGRERVGRRRHAVAAARRAADGQAQLDLVLRRAASATRRVSRVRERAQRARASACREEHSQPLDGAVALPHAHKVAQEAHNQVALHIALCVALRSRAPAGEQRQGTRCCGAAHAACSAARARVPARTPGPRAGTGSPSVARRRPEQPGAVPREA